MPQRCRAVGHVFWGGGHRVCGGSDVNRLDADGGLRARVCFCPFSCALVSSLSEYVAAQAVLGSSGSNGKYRHVSEETCSFRLSWTKLDTLVSIDDLLGLAVIAIYSSRERSCRI